MRSFINFLFTGLLIGAFSTVAVASDEPVEHTREAISSHCVILLHGLARSEWSMKIIEHRLTKKGFYVINQGYPSSEQPIESLAINAIEPALNTCQEEKRHSVSFVTHSMGGILVRSYLQSHTIPSLKHIVMLAPPNQGSPVVDKYLQSSLVQQYSMPAFEQIASNHQSYVNQLQPIAGNIGVIAGKHSINPILSRWIPGEDDGKVAVLDTCLNEMQSMIVVPTNHTMITFREMVTDQVIRFLEEGQFELSGSDSNGILHFNHCRDL